MLGWIPEQQSGAAEDTRTLGAFRVTGRAGQGPWRAGARSAQARVGEGRFASDGHRQTCSGRERLPAPAPGGRILRSPGDHVHALVMSIAPGWSDRMILRPARRARRQTLDLEQSNRARLLGARASGGCPKEATFPGTGS